MKKIFAAALLLLMITHVFAATFWVNGVLYGTICRNGAYFTSYPHHMAQPVGTSCPVRDNWGNVVGYGIVTAE